MMKVIDVNTMFANTRNLKALPLSIKKNIKKNLNISLVSPSTNHIYSEAIEIICKWFYEKFDDDFFNSKFLDASHVLDQMRRMRLQDLISATRPSANINADIEFNYNRDGADLYNLGMHMYHACSFENAFFYDIKKRLFLTLRQELMMMRFNFKIRVQTRAVQLDIAKLCQLGFRSNGSQTIFQDMDYHIPEKLILQLAYDAGFNIRVCGTGKDKPVTYSLVDLSKFLNYLNSHSYLPILYKFNPAKNHMEFFVKIMRCPIIITTGEIEIDNGNMRNMKLTDYYINFSCEVRLPAPKFYAYHSYRKIDRIVTDDAFDTQDFLATANLFFKIPEIDEHGWQWNMKTDYIFDYGKDTEMIKQGKLMHIPFGDLVGELRNVIDYVKSVALSPQMFLNIQIYSHKHIKSHIDWVNYIIYFDEPIETNKVRIVIYMDQNFFNNQTINLREYDKHRVQESDARIGEKSEQED